MTPAGKGIVLAALDILIETKTLMKRDYGEAKKIIEQVPEDEFPNSNKSLIKSRRQKNEK